MGKSVETDSLLVVVRRRMRRKLQVTVNNYEFVLELSSGDGCTIYECYKPLNCTL